MKGKFNIIFFFLFVFTTAEAQKPEEVLKNWSAKTPIEKIYLHLDRDNYIAGETAWFKAYLYSDYLPDTISTVLYVELLDGSSSVISRKILPVLLSNSSGQIELPDSLTIGSYHIRAYTSTMLNQDPGFIYKRNIFIYGKKNNTAGVIKPIEQSTRVEFFPEGGNFINGFTNTIAFKATNEKGFPVTISGSIRNEKNEEITTLSSYHDGMGMFELLPSAGTKYYVLLNGDAGMKKYPIPESTDKGIAVTIIPHPQGSFFEIHQQKNDIAFKVAYMIGQMQHHVVFRQEFAANKEEMQGVINTQHLNSGILQITFFNKEGLPLAERLCFVNNKEYIQQAELVADTINFSGRAKNRFSIVLKDTVKGSFSISVTDPEYSVLPAREENIFSGLLLTSDLKGYIHNPAYYFSEDNDTARTALDLVMMTNGWRRFKWTELVKSPPAANEYKDPSYITLAGKVNLLDSKKAFAEKQLVLFITGPDSTRTAQMINTDKQGFFRLDSMLFFGYVKLLFSDIRGKKSQYIEINLSGDSLNRSFVILPFEKRPLFTTDPSVTSGQLKMGIDYDFIQKAGGLMMKGITLKVKKKTAIEELEEKYDSGMFAGGDNKTIDLVNNKETAPYQNIFDYLQSRVPGLTVMEPNITDASIPAMGGLDDGTSYKVYYRYSPSASSLGPIPMTLYLNEIESSASVIATIPASQIAMIKLYSSFAGTTGNGAGGVLAIYTKKDADMADAMQHKADLAFYNGFSVIKEFYAPNYMVDKTAKEKRDQRITLDWRPNVFVNSIDSKIPFSFYNNDRTKKFRIVVEGMTNTGKLIFIEKTISASSLKPF
jgi:hypothetical protein